MHASSFPDRPEPAPPLPVSMTRRWVVTALATLVMSVSYIDRQTIAALAPTVREALHISHEQYGTVLAAFSMAYLVGAPLAGMVIDRTGARRGLVFAVLVWSAVAAAHALVPSLAVLIGMRLLLGLAEAPSFPGGAQTVKRILPKEHRSTGFGLLFTGSSIGAMIAAPLAIGIHHATGDWRPAFLGTALLGLLWIPLWLAATKSPAVREALATRSDDPGEAPAASAPSRLRLLVSAPVGRAMMVVVFVAPSIMFGLNWSSQYLADAFALKQDALAQYLWVPPVFFDLGAVVFGLLASRADRRAAPLLESHTALMAGAALLASTMAAVPFLHDPWLATILIALSLAGGGGTYALVTSDMLARVHPTQVSMAGGMAAAAQSLAYMVASPLIGKAFDVSHSYARSLLILGVIVPPAMIAWALWPVPAPAPPPPPPPPPSIPPARARSKSIRPE